MASVINAARWLLITVIAVTATATPATAAAPVADIPFGIATDQLFDEARNDGRQGEQGQWQLLHGRLRADALDLTFKIEPPRVRLPVQPGPAVLYGGLHLFGDAGGDVATGQWVDSFVAVTLPPCANPACQYTADIALSLRDLAPAISRLETHGSLMWVSAELTLVRSFGGGSWLQVLPFMFGGAGALEADAGRLGSIKPATGTLFPFGLFPSEQATPIAAEADLLPTGFDYGADVEQRRRAAGDASAPLPTTPGFLHVMFNPTCEGSFVLTLHDEDGDRIFDAPLSGVPLIDERLPVPLGVPWWLTLQDGGGIDFDQGRQGTGVRIGPIGPTEAPIAIDAAFDCSVPRGVVRVDGAIVGPTGAPASSDTANGSVAATFPGASPAATPPPDAPARPTWTNPAIFLVVGFAAVALLLGTSRRRRDRR